MGIQSLAAKDWLARLFQRTLERHLDGPVELAFVVLESPGRDGPP